ncbi:MAG: IS630 family transposase [Bacteroidota bacterium]
MAKLKMEQLLRCCPKKLGYQTHRWTLIDLLQACKFIRLSSLSGLYRVLKRLGISLQRAKSWIRSPDPNYAAKLAFMKACMKQSHEQRVELLFLDEFTYSIHATINRAYAPHTLQPKAHRAVGYEKTWRVLATMNGLDGQVFAIQRAHIRVVTFIHFLKALVEHHSSTQRLFIVMDNWPVHFHPDVVDALEPQLNPLPLHLPASWRRLQPSGKYSTWNLPVQLVPLPTYASWLNPIEKLWKWLKKDIIHHHQCQLHFDQLKELVGDWLSQFDHSSNELLKFTGLLKDNGIYADVLLNKNGTV